MRVRAASPIAATSYIDLERSAPTTTRAGVITFLVAQLGDRFGNLLDYGGYLKRENTSMTYASECRARWDERLCHTNGGMVVDVADPNSGLYSIYYRMTAAGFYHISVTVWQQNIQGSPVRIVVNPGPIHGPNTIAACAFDNTTTPTDDVAWTKGQNIEKACGLYQAVAGNLASFVVAAIDRFGNTITLGDDKLITIVRSSSYFAADITDFGNGTYGVQYMVTQSSLFVIDVKISKVGAITLPLPVPIRNSPFSARAFPAELPSAVHTVVYGPGLAEGTVGQVRWFTIEARDVWGNRKTKGGDNFRVVLTLKPKPLLAPFYFGEIEDRYDGTHRVTFMLTRASKYAVEIAYRARAFPYDLSSLKGNPWEIHMQPGPTDPASTTARGGALSLATAGVRSEFIIEQRDIYGNIQGDSDDFAELSLQGGAVLDGDYMRSPTVPGTLIARYTTTVAGDYKLTVMVNGEGIRGNRFDVITRPHVIKAFQCDAVGSGLSTDILVDDKVTFTMQARDIFGNIRTQGGDPVTVQVFKFISDEANPRLIPYESNFKDDKNGKYSTDYLVTQSGEFRVYVMIDDDHIRNSPFPVRFHAGLPDASKTTASGEGIQGGLKGESMTFIITSRDKYGNRRTEGGLAQSFSITFTGSGAGRRSVVPEDILDMKDGTYLFAYVAPSGGALSISVKVNGVHISASPFSVVVKDQPGPPVAQKTEASGPGKTGSIAGCPDSSGMHECPEDTGRVVITLRDSDGVKLNGRGDKQVSAQWSAPAGTISTTYYKPGEYSVQYTTTVAGTYQMSVLLGSEHIKGSPISVFVNAATAVASMSNARLPYTAVCTAGEPGKLVVEAKDRFGNSKVYDLVTPSDNIAGILTGSDSYEATAELEKSTGLFGLVWTATKAGMYNFTVTLNGAGIRGSPFIIQVEPGVMKAENAKIFGEGRDFSTAGEPSTFKIQVRDAYGNPTVPADITGISFTAYLQSWGQTELSAVFPACREGVTCSGHGTCKAAPEIGCECEGKFDGNNCNICSPNWYDSPGSNSCDMFSWPCEYCTNGRGTCPPGKLECKCRRNFVGTRCEKCAPGFYGSTCSKFCDPFLTCGGRGNCTANGDCWMYRVPAPTGSTDAVNEFDGRYIVTVAGTYALHVVTGLCDLSLQLPDPCSKAMKIAGTPLFTTSSPGRVDATASQAYGAGISFSTSGVAATFFIRARDRYSNKRTVGGDPFRVILAGAQTLKVPAIDLSTGIYSVSYTLQIAGEYEGEIRFGDSLVNGKPYTIQVAAGPIDGARCTASGVGTEATAGARFTFAVQARDKFGSRRLSGSDQFVVSMRLEATNSTYTNYTIPSPNGNYLASLLPRGTGQFIITVSLKLTSFEKDLFGLDQPVETLIGIEGSPYTGVVLPGAVDPGQSAVVTRGFSIIEDGPSNRECDQCDGSLVKESGAGYEPSVALVLSDNSGHFIELGPQVSLPPSQADLYECTDCRVGFMFGRNSLRLYQRGNPCQCLNKSFVGPFSRIRSRDEISYARTITTSGYYQIHVKLGNTHVQGRGCSYPQVAAVLMPRMKTAVPCSQWQSPVSFRVTGGPIDPKNCRAYGPGLKNYAVTGMEFTGASFVLNSIDSFGNIRMTDDSELFQLIVTTSASSTLVGEFKASSSPGELIGSYAQTVAGINQVIILTGGEQIFGSPFIVDIDPGEPYYLSSKVTGNGLFFARKGYPSGLVLTMMDYFSNIRSIQFKNVKQQMDAGLGDDKMIVFQPFNRSTYNESTKLYTYSTQLFRFNPIGKNGENYTVEDIGGEGQYRITFSPAVEGKVEYNLLLCNRTCCNGTKCDILEECKAKGTCDQVSCRGPDGFVINPCVPAMAASFERSPFQPTIVRDYSGTRAKNSIASGFGVQRLGVRQWLFQTAGVEGSFRIEAADNFGVSANRGGDAWETWVATYDPGTGDLKNKVNIMTRDTGDGSYYGAYYVTAAGLYSVGILHSDIDLETGDKAKAKYIHTAPFQPAIVLPSMTVADVSTSTVQSVATAGNEMAFYVQARDAYGNKQAYQDVLPGSDGSAFPDKVTVSLVPYASANGTVVYGTYRSMPACSAPIGTTVPTIC